jgi:hypothetical protein
MGSQSVPHLFALFERKRLHEVGDTAQLGRDLHLLEEALALLAAPAQVDLQQQGISFADIRNLSSAPHARA